MAPPFWGKKGSGPLLWEVASWRKPCTSFASLNFCGRVREGTCEELLHHEGIYNMHYFLACRTNVMSTLRLLKRVFFCYSKLVFSLKWLGLSAGEISRLNTIAQISKNTDLRNGLIFPNTPRWDLSFGTLKRTKFQNVMVLNLTEINSSLKWPLL